MSITPAALRFELDYLEVPAPKILLKPQIVIAEQGDSCEEFFYLNVPSRG